MIITVADFRKCGICPDAKRVFFEPNGLDWKGFIRHGIDSDALRATGQHLDAIARLEAAATDRMK